MFHTQYRIPGTLNIRDAYNQCHTQHGHEKDPAQESIIARLEQLQQRLLIAQSPQRGLRRLFGSGQTRAVQGLYLWGGVGRGKTFLMDLFFETLDIEAKKRIHFHRMMHEVHTRLNKLGATENPLEQVAADIAAETRVLCFDEFFVSDIGNAMILGALLEGLFRHGVTLISTSNSPPDELYKEGLQRQRFMPAIELLKKHTQVVHMDGNTDYRLRLLQQAGTYLTPDDDAARQKLQHYFDESASSQIARDDTLEINGREIGVRMNAKGIAWFDFATLCDGPRSQSDYIEIARWYPTVILSGVPRLDETLEDQARRFVALVDEFYDRHVKLVVSATESINSLYCGTRLEFEFDRTMSRLIEMQSTDYLALPHLA
jgi:cell division protein ZapE